VAPRHPPPDGRREDGQVAGNVARVADLLAAGASPRALRYALIAVHYPRALQYSDESLAAAAAAIERLDAVLLALAGYHEDGPDDPRCPRPRRGAATPFDAAMDQDLNVSAALAALFELIPRCEPPDRRPVAVDRRRRARDGPDPGLSIACLRSRPPRRARWSPRSEALLHDASGQRADRDWAASDRLRDELLARGIVVEDTA
jgi:cysteinyl-tRNA synthetase